MLNPIPTIPVIAIDGPSASGKGTVANRVAQILGFGYLDSGALYRVLAYLANAQGIDLSDEIYLAQLAHSLPVQFKQEAIIWQNQDISEAVRSEQTGTQASLIATLPSVRQALLTRQRAFVTGAGLVADGRDMASVVFPQAALKVFLTASVEIRAERRFKQLNQKRNNAILADILQDLQARDTRDTQRAVAPLVQLPDAILLDTSALTIDAAVDFILQHVKQRKISVF